MAWYREVDHLGNLISEVEVPNEPLDPAGVAATLNVVLGLWPIEDAANAVGLMPADLEAEARAWEIAFLTGR